MVDWRLSGRHQDEKMTFLQKNQILSRKIFSFLPISPTSHVSINFKLLPSERSPYEKFISQKFSLCLVRLDFFRIFQSRPPSQKMTIFVVFVSFRHVTLIFGFFHLDIRNHRPKITLYTQSEAWWRRF